jgi:hypothetical protein
LFVAVSPAAAESLDTTTDTYGGETYEEDALEYHVSVEDVEGDDGPVAVFVGPDAEYVYEDSISGSDGEHSGTVDLGGRIPAGDVTVLYLHPNHPDGEMGDGEFEWGNTNFGPVPANVTSLGDLIDEMSGDLEDRDDVVQDLIEETADATGSTDLLEKHTFTLSDQASVEIVDVGAGDPDGVGTAKPGAELVVRGTTNLDPEERHIEVRALDGPQVHDSSSYQDILDNGDEGYYLKILDNDTLCLDCPEKKIIWNSGNDEINLNDEKWEAIWEKGNKLKIDRDGVNINVTDEKDSVIVKIDRSGVKVKSN